MDLILCIETSSINCSVALFNGKELISIAEESRTYAHSEKINIFIEDVVKSAHVEFEMLKAIAVGSGPGSFTGLRIGVSTTKGLCYGLNIPLIATSSLRTMTQMAVQDGFFESTKKAIRLCPLIDARRMEVYSCFFDAELKQRSEIEALIIDEAFFLPHLSESEIHFFGDGMEKVRALYDQHPNAKFIEGILPSGKFMIYEAFEKYESKKFEDPAYFEPFYLKDFKPTTPKKSKLS